ncbi:hypothetical protein CCACVL1_00683, partial [Corchorus capsularis]
DALDKVCPLATDDGLSADNK